MVMCIKKNHFHHWKITENQNCMTFEKVIDNFGRSNDWMMIGLMTEWYSKKLAQKILNGIYCRSTRSSSYGISTWWKSNRSCLQCWFGALWWTEPKTQGTCNLLIYKPILLYMQAGLIYATTQIFHPKLFFHFTNIKIPSTFPFFQQWHFESPNSTHV